MGSLEGHHRELQGISGEKIGDDSQIEAGARKWVGEGRCEAIDVSIGAEGALLVSREGAERLRALHRADRGRGGSGR